MKTLECILTHFIPWVWNWVTSGSFLKLKWPEKLNILVDLGYQGNHNSATTNTQERRLVQLPWGYIWRGLMAMCLVL